MDRGAQREDSRESCTANIHCHLGVHGSKKPWEEEELLMEQAR